MTGVTFYHMRSDYRVVNKNLTTIGTTQAIEPYNPLSDITGFIVVSYDANWYSANYAKVGDKYYYITGREVLTGGMMRIVLHVDVLMNVGSSETFRNIKIIPTRSNDKDLYNSWIADGSQPYELAKDTTVSNPVGYDESLLPNGCLNYTSGLTVVAGIIGTDSDVLSKIIEVIN